MTYNSEIHHRHSLRLPFYDYASPGSYFITICTRGRECLFGKIEEKAMVLNKYGEIARACWCAIPAHFSYVELDEFIVMPNHIHGILNVGAQHAVPLRGESRKFGKLAPSSLSVIVRSYKSAVSRRINEFQQMHQCAVWQRSFFDHIIRSESALWHIRNYIVNNPAQWDFDIENQAPHL